jgi:hypothetical protein
MDVRVPFGTQCSTHKTLFGCWAVVVFFGCVGDGRVRSHHYALLSHCVGVNTALRGAEHTIPCQDLHVTQRAANH